MYTNFNNQHQAVLRSINNLTDLSCLFSAWTVPFCDKLLAQADMLFSLCRCFCCLFQWEPLRPISTLKTPQSVGADLNWQKKPDTEKQIVRQTSGRSWRKSVCCGREVPWRVWLLTTWTPSGHQQLLTLAKRNNTLQCMSLLSLSVVLTQPGHQQLLTLAKRTHFSVCH